MTTAENASDWRELAADLPADKSASLGRLEAKLAAAGIDGATIAEVMLGLARQAVIGATIQTYADLPIPPGATDVGDWEPSTAGGWSRTVTWASFDGDGRIVDVAGNQRDDGTVTRRIIVWGVEDGAEFDAGGARRLAADLLNAADLLDGQVNAAKPSPAQR
jgi:hypothetical protein